MKTKFLLPAVAGAVLLCAMPANATVDQAKAVAGLQAMRELNLIVFQDLQSGHEVEGKAFVGGNVSGNAENFGVGNTNQGAAANNRSILTVGGNIVANNIQVNNGSNGNGGAHVADNVTNTADVGANITGSLGLNVQPGHVRVGGSFNNQNFNPSSTKTVAYGQSATNLQPQDAPYVVQDPSLAAPGTGLAATIAVQTATLQDDLTNLSNLLGGLNSLATITGTGSALDYAGATNGVAVFTMTATAFQDSNANFDTLFTGMPSNVVTIINVLGTNLIENGNLNTNAINQSVIWNFNQATTVSLKGFHGSVLAPNAVVSNSSAIEGSIVAKLFQQNGEVHLGTFNGITPFQVPTGGGTGSVPEPATWAMMLLGFGVTGSAIRRKRREERRAAA
ncbi:MAG: choice-of-anchor A family protein [Sphingomonas sp.]|nr:choice-of-anchor A family protein [Sphingomonas sp.]